jgi:hypothetical protein
MRCWTIFGCTPRPSNRVAQVWRSSCQLMLGKPVRRSRGLKWRLTIFWASSGVPMVVVNTSPLSVH